MRRPALSSSRFSVISGSAGVASRGARVGLVALVAAIGLAGCGGGDDGKANTDAGGSAAATSPALAAAPGKPATPEEDAAIQAVNAAAYAAVKGKDGAAFCKLLTKQAIEILTAGSEEKGSSAQKCATIATKVAEGVQPGDVTPERLSAIKVDGARAVGQTGERVTNFEKVGGKWLLGIAQGQPEVEETTP